MSGRGKCPTGLSLRRGFKVVEHDLNEVAIFFAVEVHQGKLAGMNNPRAVANADAARCVAVGQAGLV